MLVRDYDEAIDWYTHKLGFVLIEDADRGNGKRWVLIAPGDSNETRLLLAKAHSPEQLAHVGNQAGGRVFLFLHTADFELEYRLLCERGVHFEEAPRRESYGKVAVFQDLYGNRWDLLQLL